VKTGILYGIGVGPGDPELITLKAARVLERVGIVFAAASTKNAHSLAEKIVSPHLHARARIVRLDFPMTRDRERLSQAWRKNAKMVVGTLEKGEDAALVTLGDPLTYSTFGYIMQTIRGMQPDIPIRIIPGITSYQAASASAEWVLAEGEESFAVVSGALGAEKLKGVIGQADNVVVLKVYRHYNEIMNALQELDLSEKSVLISRCGLDGEEISFDLQQRSDTHPSYLSLLLIRKKNR
jgi:precorrin-2/cobalt-factor-2 C20-methyltransferase